MFKLTNTLDIDIIIKEVTIVVPKLLPCVILKVLVKKFA